MARWIHLGVENNLDDSLTISQLHEDEPSQVPSPLHPSQEGHLTTDIFFPQISAVVCPFEISEKFRLPALHLHDIHPFDHTKRR